MQKKFTDAVIIKALECCSVSPQVCSDDCPFLFVNKCGQVLRENALDIINRQKAEIERLKAKKELYLNRWQESLDFAKQDRAEAIREFAEIIVSEFPEIEFYTNKLAKEMTDGD